MATPGVVQVMTLTGNYIPSTSEWVRDQVGKYEASGGTEGNEIMGLPIVVITSRGAKSGNLRKNPVADPHVDLQDGPEAASYVARIATGEERAEWWERAVAAFPNYAEYHTKTDREIPVFLLERA